MILNKGKLIEKRYQITECADLPEYIIPFYERMNFNCTTANENTSFPGYQDNKDISFKTDYQDFDSSGSFKRSTQIKKLLRISFISKGLKIM